MNWGTLAKIGLIGAAPFTGGATLAAIPAVSAMGDVLGKQQEGAAKGNIAQAQLGQGQDRNAIDLYQAQQGAQKDAAALDIQRKQYADTTRRTSAKDALLASLLGGDYKGTEVNVPGIQNAKVSGGLLESLKNSPGSLAAMRNLAQQSDVAQMTPPTFTGGQMLAAPTMTALPQQGTGSKVMDAIARIAQIGGAVGSAYGASKGGG
jgi:hypothetical protein